MAALDVQDGRPSWTSTVTNSIVTEGLCSNLRAHGYAMIDGAFGEHARHLLEEAQGLSEHPQGFIPHTFRFGAYTLTKPSIYEADLIDPRLTKGPPLKKFKELFESGALAAAFNDKMPELSLEEGTKGATLKIQKNTGGGGCFPLHFDNPGPPNKRKLTCLLYLNESWSEGDGGELELRPLFSEPIVLAPLLDRFVVFYSDRCLHRVRPANAPRFCFTIWIDGANVNSPDEVNLKARHLSLGDDEARALLASSPLQRVVSRALFDDDYRQSLIECLAVPEGAGERGEKVSSAMLAEHAAHVKGLRGNPALSDFLCRLMQQSQADAPGI